MGVDRVPVEDLAFRWPDRAAQIIKVAGMTHSPDSDTWTAVSDVSCPGLRDGTDYGGSVSL